MCLATWAISGHQKKHDVRVEAIRPSTCINPVAVGLARCRVDEGLSSRNGRRLRPPSLSPSWRPNQRHHIPANQIVGLGMADRENPYRPGSSHGDRTNRGWRPLRAALVDWSRHSRLVLPEAGSSGTAGEPSDVPGSGKPVTDQGIDGPLRGAMPGMKLGRAGVCAWFAVVSLDGAGREGACWVWRAVRRHRVTMDRSRP